MTCLRIAICGAFFLAVLAPSVAKGAMLQFIVDPTRMDDNGEIRFTTESLSPDQTVGQLRQLQNSTEANYITGRTNKNIFVIVMNVDDIKARETLGRFRYVFYVFPTAMPDDAKAARFSVWSDPVGEFSDRLKGIVSFRVVTDKEDEFGHIEIPLHGFSRHDFLRLSLEHSPVGIPIWPDSNVPVQVENLLDGLGIEILGTPPLEVENASYWQTVETTNFLGKMPPHQIAKLATLHLKPTIKSILAILVRPFDEVHDRIKMSVRYRADFGGGERQATFDVPVKLVMPAQILVVIALVGASVGFVAKSVASRSKLTWRRLAAAFVLSAIAQLLALYVASNNTKFVLLGIDLDARQPLAALLIGIFVGLFGTNMRSFSALIPGKK